MAHMMIKENYPLKSLNTFGIDAKAKYFIAAGNEEQLQEVIDSGMLLENRYYILGGGSNTLFTGDFDGLILKLETKNISSISVSENDVLVKAEAGVDWNDLIEYCLSNHLGGLENLTLIPGNVGAAPIQNIGAYGVEQEQLFEELSAIELSSGKKMRFNKEQCQFSYRNSIFKNELKGKYIITEVVYRLSRKHNLNLEYAPLKAALDHSCVPEINIRKVSETVAEIRRSKLPDPQVTGNAGSFFKNPVIAEEVYLRIKENYPQVPGYRQKDQLIKIPAAWLIEQSGWKGRHFGNAGVHSKQALVIINLGNADGAEILKISQQVSQDVYSRFGIRLQREVNVV